MTIGAESHKYELGVLTSVEEVSKFETKYHVELPEDYKTFLSEIDKGGIDYPKSCDSNSAAGPSPQLVSPLHACYGKLTFFVLALCADIKS